MSIYSQNPETGLPRATKAFENTPASAGTLPGIVSRELLRYAVMTAIFSPYGGDLLDVRRAVLIDGSDFTQADGKTGGMLIMTAAEFDKVIENIGGVDALKAKLGHDFKAYDGRELFS